MEFIADNTSEREPTVAPMAPALNGTHKNVGELLEMLTLTRKHGSEGEKVFADNFVMPLSPEIYKDPAGNVLAYVVEVRNPCDMPHDTPNPAPLRPILFSCHIDTVHSSTDPVIQNILYDKETQFVYKDDKRPLGADDAAGVWLLRRMIEAGVPGAYIFHRGEECGGIGSSGMAVHFSEYLSQFSYAIAFDRRGQESIITEQMRGKCASNEFATALGDLLMSAGTGVELDPDDTGMFTDTANYTTLISECTNLSVGYENEHSGDEFLDVDYLIRLTDAVVHVFSDPGICDKLPVVRDKNVVDYWGGYGAYGSEWSDYQMYKYEREDKDYQYAMYAGTGKKGKKGKGGGKHIPSYEQEYEYLTHNDLITMRFDQVVRYVNEASAEDVADLLMDMADRLAWSKK